MCLQSPSSTFREDGRSTRCLDGCDRSVVCLEHGTVKTLQLPSFTLCPFKLCPWTSSADLNTFSYRKSITTHNDEASHHHLKTNPWLLSNLTQLCSHLVHLEWLISVSHVDKSSLAFFWGLSSLLKGSVRASSALLPKSSPISSDCGYRTNAEIE